MPNARRVYTRYRDGVAEVCYLMGIEDIPEVDCIVTNGVTCKKWEVPNTARLYSPDGTNEGSKLFATWTSETGLVLI